MDLVEEESQVQDSARRTHPSTEIPPQRGGASGAAWMVRQGKLDRNFPKYRLESEGSEAREQGA